MGKTETTSSKARNETRTATFSTLIQYSAGYISQSSLEGERNKSRSNYSLFADDIFYLKKT
jgi:hypothetical protein